MKTVYLMRHAKSSWSDASASDHERGLNSRGKRDAPFMSEWLKEKGEKIDTFLVSDARRTKETSTALLKVYPDSPIKYVSELYLASAATILKHLQEMEDEHNSILLLAHNPGISYAVELLCNVQVDNVPTSGIAKISFDTNTFKDIQAGSGKLVFFATPKKIYFDASN